MIQKQFLIQPNNSLKRTGDAGALTNEGVWWATERSSRRGNPRPLSSPSLGAAKKVVSVMGGLVDPKEFLGHIDRKIQSVEKQPVDSRRDSVIEIVRERNRRGKKSLLILFPVFILTGTAIFFAFRISQFSLLISLLSLIAGLLAGASVMRLLWNYRVPSFSKILSGNTSEELINEWIREEAESNRRFVSNWQDYIGGIFSAVGILLLIFLTFEFTRDLALIFLLAFCFGLIGAILLLAIVDRLRRLILAQEEEW